MEVSEFRREYEQYLRSEIKDKESIPEGLVMFITSGHKDFISDFGEDERRFFIYKEEESVGT